MLTKYLTAIKIFKILDLREGEIQRTMLMQTNIFIIICTLMIVKPAANGLFLSRFGVESLPFAFIIVAVTAAIVSGIYTRILPRITLYKIFNGTLIISIVSLLLFGVLLRLNLFENIILYLFYLWVAVFALLTTSQFWIFSNLVFNAREAKRLFSLIGAAAITGGIVGGYLTSILANIMNSEFLLLICASMLMVCIPINYVVWKKYVVGMHAVYEIKKSKNRFTGHPFFRIKESKHLTLIAIMLGVSVIVAKLIDYQFGGIASSLIKDSDELTSFFGFWFSTINIISLLLQLFVTRHIVGTFGVGNSLLFHPIFIFFATTILFFVPELLFTAVFLKLSDGSMKQSIQKSAMELLILPIPQHIKNQTKIFIDVFVDSFATGVSGLILILLVQGFNLPIKFICLIIMFFVILWIFLAFKARNEYLNSFRQKINYSHDQKRKIRIDPFNLENESVLNGLKKVLRDGTEKQIIFVLQKLREINDSRIHDEIRYLMNHESAEVRAESLKNLYFHSNGESVIDVEKLIHDESEEVRIQAFEYLIRHQYEEKEIIIKKYLEDESKKIRLSALVALSIETKNNPIMKKRVQIEERLDNLMNEMICDSENRNFLIQYFLKAAGHSRIPKFFPTIIDYMKDSDLNVVKNAFESAAHTMDPYFISELIQSLKNPTSREFAIISLSFYGIGILPILKEIAEDANQESEVLLAISAISLNTPVQESVNINLILLDQKNMEVKKEALRTLNLIKKLSPQLYFDKKDLLRRIHEEAKLYHDTISVLYTQLNASSPDKMASSERYSDSVYQARKSLTSLLKKRLDDNLYRIFILLNLQDPKNEYESIYQILKKDTKESRINAIEYLDNLLNYDLKKILIPIVESSIMESITEDVVRRLNLRIQNEFECFKKLLEGKDYRVKLAILYLIGTSRNESYEPLICISDNDKDDRIVVYSRKIRKVLFK